MLSRIVLFVALLCASLHVEAQATLPTKALHFEALTINDGLSQGMITCMLQDRYGFMWFGTKDGLNRYDGYQFVVYRRDDADKKSLADNYIQSLFEDSKGLLWVGTVNSGVDLFDRKTESFIHFKHNPTNPNSIGSNEITSIQEDKQGKMWIGTRNGLNKLLLDDKVVTQQTADRAVTKKFFQGNTFIKIDSRGIVWGSWLHGFAFRIKPGEHVDAVDTLPVESYSRYPAVNKGLERFLQLMVEDTARGNMLFVTENSIAQIDLVTHATTFLSEGRHNMGIFYYDGCIDASRVMWLSENGWLQQFDLATNKMTRVLAIDPNHNAAIDNASCTFIDRTGMVWIGTRGYGILKYNPRSEKFHKTDNASIGWMTALPDGRISVAKKRYALCLFNPTLQEYDVQVLDSAMFVKYPSLDFGHSDALMQDADGMFWICKNGLVAYDVATGKMESYKRDGDALIGVFPIYNDGDFIWVGTKYGFSRFDKRNKTFTDFPYPVTQTNEPYTFLQRIYKDASGIFWLGTLQGLLRFDPDNQTWKRFANDPSETASLGNNIVFTICPDPFSPDKYLWIGTNGGGLNRFDISTEKFLRYTERNGLPNNVVYGILTDDDKNLWLSTNKGLSRFNTATKAFKNFGSRDGLQGDEFNRNAYCKSNDGILYFGGVNGFNFFNPRDLVNNDVVPNVLITDFKLSNQSVSINSKESPLTQPSYLTSDVTLPYSEQMITLVFASTDFTASGKNQYRYKLEGFNNAWIEAGNHNTATFTNLDPGSYTFKVQGSNSDGIWNQTGASLNLIVLPPWYMTWWFRAALVVMIGGMIYGVYRYRLRQALKLQEVRNRIAQDLHDEVGSNLSSINIFSEVGKAKSELVEVHDILGKINQHSKSSMGAMSDIVWMITARNDKFDNIVVHMRELAVQLFETAGVNLHIDFDPKLDDARIGMEARKNFYLVFKEAVNNIVKYAQAENVWISMSLERKIVTLTIKDDGVGFDANELSSGNGLVNMQSRAAALNGKLRIESQPGHGALVELSFNVSRLP